jgi:hypothetical protein
MASCDNQPSGKNRLPNAIKVMEVSMNYSETLPLYDQSYDRDDAQERLRRSGLKDDQFTSETRSIGTRVFRALARFFIAVLIGVGVTLGWQSYGDEAKKMARTWAPSLSWLLPVSKMKSPSDGQMSAASAAPSPELVQQLKPMAVNLADIRRSIEQLASRQERMDQNITTLQTIEQDIRQKISSPPPSRATPPRKPPQPTAQSSAGP